MAGGKSFVESGHRHGWIAGRLAPTAGVRYRGESSTFEHGTVLDRAMVSHTGSGSIDARMSREVRLRAALHDRLSYLSRAGLV